MKRDHQPVTLEKIREVHSARGEKIRAKLAEFNDIWQKGSDERIWEEMVFCFFTGGCSARMGLRSIEAVRRLLMTGTHEELMTALVGVHRYPRARARYIVASRAFLNEHCQMRLRRKLKSIGGYAEIRDWLVKEKRIVGLGYKEASHFLRNIGFKGCAILDKHILRSMAELGLIDDPKPPGNRTRYLAYEASLRALACDLNIDFDELDLVLWSLKTGEILK